METLYKLVGFTDVTPVIDKGAIENICFKGGGMKGNAFIGVAKALEELGIRDNIKRVIGSSAGAIFAGAVACKITYTDLKEAIESTDYSKFRDGGWGTAGEGVRLIEYLGLYKGDYFYNWYGDMLEKFVRDSAITLKGVQDRFGIELTITVTDLTKGKLVFLNPQDNPDLQLRDAVRMSMSIPVFYVPVTRVDSDGLKHYYVDGGCTDNYPLDYFDDLYPSKAAAFSKTIGFDLEDGNEPVAPNKYIDHTNNINNIIDLVTGLINTVIQEVEKARLTETDKYRSVEINTGSIDATDFDMSREQIYDLIEEGYRATMSFFGENISKM